MEMMRVRNAKVTLFSCLLLSSFAGAQSDKPAPDPFAKPEPRSITSDETNSSHRFWDHTNLILFSGIAVSRTLDYTSTRNMLARGRQEILIPDDVVYSRAGFPALEVAGAAASVGISYLLHRTGHHRYERWLSIGHIGVTDFGAVRNYSLESRHR
jgi:hypothetical protein